MRTMQASATTLWIGLLLFSWAGEPVCADQFGLFTYEVDDATITITGYPKDAGGDITIPSVIAGLPVTSIGERAFEDCRALTSVTLSDGITEIGMYAFQRCTSLAAIDLPDSLTTIHAYAFLDCIGLSSIFIPDSVTLIDSIFYGCTGLTTIEVGPLNANYSSLDGVLFNRSQTALLQFPQGRAGAYAIPNGVTSIGSAFWGCTRLTSVSIPGSVTSIGYGTCYGCTSLASVTIQFGVTSIGDYAFENCTSLTSITVPDSVTSIGYEAFYGCTGLTSVSLSNALITIGSFAFQDCISLTSITLPDSLTGIGEDSFRGCSSLVAVTIGSGLKYIGPGAFAGCTGLASVSLPDGLNTIADGAFAGCSFNSVSIPDSVTTVGFGAFGGCSSLASVSIGSGVNGINEFTFRYCTSLTAIEVSLQNLHFSSLDGVLFNKARTSLIKFPAQQGGHYSVPDTVQEIRDLAFEGCATLTSLFIPGSVAEIGAGSATGAGAIPGCLALTQIDVDPTNPQYSSLDGVLYNKDGTQLIQYPAGKAGAYSIPASVSAIGEAAFMGSKGLTSVSIPESVTSIVGYAFADCTGLASISIPDNVTGIEPYAFNGCTGLTSLSLPDSCTYIADRAFGGCTGLATVSVGQGVSVVDPSAFDDCTGLTGFTVDALNPTYRSIDGVLLTWSPFKLIKYPSMRPGDHYTVPDGVIELGDNGHDAFDHCTLLTSITIPASVSTPTIIDAGYAKFQGCSNLTTIEMDDPQGSSDYFSYDGVLFYRDYFKPSYVSLARFPPGRVGTYSVPEWVSGIYARAFEGSIGLDSIVFTGDAPSFAYSPEIPAFPGAAPGFTIYYFRGKLWFTSPTWNGYPSVMIDPAVNPAAEWLLGYGMPYDTDLHQDLNGDGVSLLVAYALDLDPNLDLRTSLPAPLLSAQDLSISFQAVSLGITYSAETSTDLLNWTTNGVILSAPDSFGQRTASVTRDGPMRFLRLSVGD